MKNFATFMIISSVSLTAFGYTQSYGYDQYPQGRPYSYEASNPNYPSQPGYGVQPQPGYSAQPQYYPQGGQPQYRDGRSMDRGYPSDAQRNVYQNGSAPKQSDRSSWSNWIGGDDKTPVVADDIITSNVQTNLLSTPYFSNSAKNIQVSTKDGKVTLKGRVANKNEKNQIEYMVKNVEGVRSVSNDLETEK